MNEENLKKVQQRASQYWFVDGLAEIFMGGICLLLGLYFMLYQIAPATGWLNLVLFASIFIVGFVLRRIMLGIKERTTYPRSGYVESKSFWGNKGLAAAWVAFTILLNAFNIYTALNAPLSPVWTPLIGGVIFAAIFISIAYLNVILRFYYLAFFCLITGGAMVFSGLGEWFATALLCGLTGLILLTFGILTRRAYLQQNPQAPQV